MDNGPHAFDLIRYLLGEIDQVKAEVIQGQAIAVEDTAQVYCRLASGVRGVMDLSWTLPVPSKTYLEIYGQEGSLVLDFEGLAYKFKTWDQWKRIPNQATMKEAFARQMEHFVGAIQGASVRVTNLEDGMRSQELIDKAYSSLNKENTDEGRIEEPMVQAYTQR